MQLGKYSMGVGDRFGRQGRAQLAAFVKAQATGVTVTPVWNKSFREHQIIGTTPDAVRTEADAAVTASEWSGAYFVDADHINSTCVDVFTAACDFFTLDVADCIGKPAPRESVNKFVKCHPELIGKVDIEGLHEPLHTTRSQVTALAEKYLPAVHEAGCLYREIARIRGAGTFVTEVSMDENDLPQAPADLLVILAAIADAEIPAQTVAPKFTGRFNKGVDYAGDVAHFEREFNNDVAILMHAVTVYGLPEGLKISVHSGSDKFRIYPAMRAVLRRLRAGLHLKTAGTTWLEELVGLALAGGEGLAVAREIYGRALVHFDELCAPYATVIDIDRRALPTPETVAGWTGEQYAAAVRHDETSLLYSPDIRQLLHVGYRIAAQMGRRYLDALDACELFVAPNVTANIYDRHIRPLFVD